jgi:hypothetical protein
MQTYKVTVVTPAGRLHLSRASALAAIETARIIRREGISEVTITDPNGRDWRDEELAAELERLTPGGSSTPGL